MLDIDLRALGLLLREAREAFGVGTLTVRELSMMTGVKESVITSYESGVRQPSLRNLWRIVTALGMDLNELRRQTLVHSADSDELDDEPTEKSSKPQPQRHAKSSCP